MYFTTFDIVDNCFWLFVAKDLLLTRTGKLVSFGSPKKENNLLISLYLSGNNCCPSDCYHHMELIPSFKLAKLISSCYPVNASCNQISSKHRIMPMYIRQALVRPSAVGCCKMTFYLSASLLPLKVSHWWSCIRTPSWCFL